MKNESMYGYPLSSVLFRIIGLLILFFFIIYLSLIVSFTLLFLLLFLIPLSWVILRVFKKQFLEIRKQVIIDMLNQVQIKGNEYVLDLGTGSGYAAISFAQKVPNGLVVGIDKYNIKNTSCYQRFLDIIKINFFGNSLKNAKTNMILENVQKNICFVKTDLTEPIPFINQSFNIITSSQLLYCIPSEKLTSLLLELDRVLSKTGWLILFESMKFMSWDIAYVTDFFEKKGYEISIVNLDYLQNKCILVGKKR